MVSGNDAANMLADMLGGQGVAIPAMNRKAAAVGARSTRAASPSGLDGPGWESITTPHDLAVIYRTALTYPLIAQIMRQEAAPFPGRTLTNQNELLSRYPGAFAGKTGFTNLAHHTYVAAAQRGSRRLVVVEMYGDGDLYGQAINLFDWGFGQSP
jgi:D-alanyl-D-alanine carboxypeptidase (penicillin-binding protein 5/6)